MVGSASTVDEGTLEALIIMVDLCLIMGQGCAFGWVVGTQAGLRAPRRTRAVLGAREVGPAAEV